MVDTRSIEATSFAQITVNVTKIEHSRLFYSLTTPLIPGEIYYRPPLPNGDQPMSSEKDSLASADGALCCLFRDPRGQGKPGILLVQHLDGRDHGHPYRSYAGRGLFRLCFRSSDVHAWFHRVVAAGGIPLTSAPIEPQGSVSSFRPVFGFSDPDGIILEYMTMQGPDSLFHVNCNVSDLDKSIDFYTNALGLTVYRRSESTSPTVYAFDREGLPSTIRTAFLKCGSTECEISEVPFTLDLIEWTSQSTKELAYEDERNIGFMELGLSTDGRSSSEEQRLMDPDGVRLVLRPEPDSNIPDFRELLADKVEGDTFVAVAALLHLYHQLVDSKVWADFDLLFPNDGEFVTLSGDVLLGPSEIARHISTVGKGAIRSPLAHHSTNLVLGDVQDDSARAVSKYFAVMSDGSLVSGVYFDILARTPSGWRIKRRQAIRLTDTAVSA
jgi:catechol 2,3-dioxygenase-like lactoylglutathione lyase family enzyme